MPAASRTSISVPALGGWVAAAAGVGLVYAVVVLGGSGATGGDETSVLVLSFVATLVVAGALDPVRQRVAGYLARTLPSRMLGPYDQLARFAQEVASPHGQGSVTRRMADVLRDGLVTEWAQVWLLVHGRPVLVASSPEGSGQDLTTPQVPTTSADPAGCRVAPVGHNGQVLGLLRVRERPGRPLSPLEERLLAGLAGQAGVILANVQLEAELRERLTELMDQEHALRSARAALVETAYKERRRLERDLHDGAQQQLVALSVNLRVAAALLEADPRRSAEVLAQQIAAVHDATATLKNLMRGEVSTSLRDVGLAPALERAFATSPVPVTVTAAHANSVPPAAATAMYYCALEAVQNAVKHAQASRIAVLLVRDEHQHRLEVADDGVGLPSGQRHGSGLRNMRERVRSVGGTIDFLAKPGGGTVVRVGVPALDELERPTPEAP